MGTWGFSVLEDDTAADVYSDYIELFNAGRKPVELLKEITRRHADALEDEDDSSVVWMAIARAQWECGHLMPRVRAQIERMVRDEAGLGRWAESGEASVRQRRKALARFLARLRSVNTRPKKPRKGIRRKPVFDTGACLAIRLSDGDYAAAVVLACVEEPERPGADTYGINLIGLLRYKSPQKPEVSVFEARRWASQPFQLTPTKTTDVTAAYNVLSLRFRNAKDRFEVVGHTQIRASDPERSDSYATWDFAEWMVRQARSEMKRHGRSLFPDDGSAG